MHLPIALKMFYGMDFRLSYSLSQTEKKYTQINQDGVTMYWGVKRFFLSILCQEEIVNLKFINTSQFSSKHV